MKHLICHLEKLQMTQFERLPFRSPMDSFRSTKKLALFFQIAGIGPVDFCEFFLLALI